ncbi:MAG: metallophosphatase [Flavobacteriales bacterium]|jgi:5'-nucleotidase|nr:metallophosphatase [Flavobacteriales bacterium]MDG1917263.1 metallophosphatase [Flavobacteriales bacterium]|tara:strand:+ start:1428 stop:2357 length:930 start_codon:yes stop_codon:yes gene_type:complete
MKTRRKFIKQIGLGTTLLGLAPFQAFSTPSPKNVKLTILHTNDMHSHIEAFSSGRNKGLGGMFQLSSLVKKIRQEEENILLLDAGDIFQGTPYFNLFGGELEFRLMSEMGYDAVTIGNHDFDNGIDGLANQMHHANFPFISSNYDFSNTILQDKVIPHKVFNKSGIKVGVFGIGIELKGLVDPNLYGNTNYLDPVSTANEKARYLKNTLNCDLVICLSHLGFKYKSNKMSDMKLAVQTKNIDLIIGGHTHSFLNEPVIVQNSANKEVLISQVGFGAIKLGKIDFYFDENKSEFLNLEHSFKSNTLDVRS